MASVTISTHTFKIVNNLELKVDIYLRSSNLTTFVSSTPVVFFIHGGGFVGFDRQHVPPHVVQSCLLRGWPLVSADYRLLPQVHGADILEDVKDAYHFVREKLPAVLTGREQFSGEGPIENIILVGQSAGAYLTYIGGLCFEPRPIAILNYYGFATTNEPYFSKPPPGTPKTFSIESVEQYLKEPVNTNMTPPANIFNPACLLPDLSRNPQYVGPAISFDNPADQRMKVMAWLIQENGMQVWFEGVDRPLDNVAWKNFPPLVMVHGDEDTTTPPMGSIKLVDIIGPLTPKCFISKGHAHAFDQPFYLGEKGLSAVEEAWAAIEEIVKKNT